MDKEGSQQTSGSQASSYAFEGWRPEVNRANLGQRGKIPRFDGRSLQDWFRVHDQRHVDVTKVAQRKILREEVEKHNDMDDMWVVIDNIVYDLTPFQLFHPGGESILRACAGKDITELYNTYHRWVHCEQLIGKLAVGVFHPQ